jgi:hypothetical protein
MELKDFNREYSLILDDIGMKPDGTIASHSLVAHVRVCTDDPEDDSDYELVGIESDQMIGCGCSFGVTLIIRKVK